ncbi:MFS transporter [Nakamurella silvestris]|nr:MFS transporter [Nakamurella silvestris]
MLLLAASSALTPLYSIYQGEWGFSPIMVTVVFGVYALAVLASLITVGSLSDHIGRRPVLIGALLLQMVTMVIFISAGGVTELLIGRVLQGLSTGAAVGALGAGLLDLSRVKGTLANGVAPVVGTATGALAASLLVRYLPAPTHLVYLVLLGVLVLQAVGVLFMAETSSSIPGALNSLRPRFAVPAPARRPLLLAAPALIAVWALAGLYGSLGPALLRQLAGSDSVILGGLALFTLAISGALTVLALRNTAPRTVMLIGSAALVLGLVLTFLSIVGGSVPVFFVGSVIAGVGFGGGFQGALRTVIPLAQPHERAGLLSTVYVVSYLAMGLPAVVAGALVVDGGGLTATAQEYVIAVLVLAVLALAGVARSRPRREVVACTPVAAAELG